MATAGRSGIAWVVVEAYRSYQEGRPAYHPEGLSDEPEYSDGVSWYAESASPDRYEDPRRDDVRRERARPAAGESARVGVRPRPAPSANDEPPIPRRPSAVPGSPGPAGDGVYRSRRPGAAFLFGGPAALLELPALLLLFDAASADPTSTGGVVAASCVILALPLLAVGLYAVATGAVRAAGPNSVQAWLRPPVAYLSVALVLFVAAGLAAG